MNLLLPLILSVSSVIVSVAPHKYFVERIAKDTVNVILMVPASSTPHSYEPPPKQILAASQADIWFKIGEGFEKKAIDAILAHHPDLQVIDLRKGLPLIVSGHSHGCCNAEGADLHIWLSLRMAQLEADTIAQGLSKRYPEHAPLYQANVAEFKKELTELDQSFKTLLAPVKGKTVMVSHPAYAYFCRDYELHQISLEVEGKEPTPKSMTQLLDKARSLKIHTIFTQAQYGTKGAELMAPLLGAKIVMLDPYAENYLDSMQKIADAFQKGLM